VKHIGIDLAKTHSNVVVLSSEGSELGRSKVRTCELGGWLGRQKQGDEVVRVVMETCTQSLYVARAAQQAGLETVVIPGHVIRALGVGARGIKTDDRDAEVLARASVRNKELPSVHLRSPSSEERRELLMARAALVDARRLLSVRVKAWLRARLLTIRGRASSLAFCEAVRRIASKLEQGVPLHIEKLLEVFEQLTSQIESLDEEIARVTKDDPLIRRLTAICGVGPQVSLAFVSHIDDPKRFRSADEVASYLALVPGESTTGGKVRRTGTIKAGPVALKALLVQAAWSMVRARPNEPMVIWAKTIAARRGKRIAIVALARKLATVMWAMWKHGTNYDPQRTTSGVLTTEALVA
jgi:transposase